jgi:hypothetical protein
MNIDQERCWYALIQIPSIANGYSQQNVIQEQGAPSYTNYTVLSSCFFSINQSINQSVNVNLCMIVFKTTMPQTVNE